MWGDGKQRKKRIKTKLKEIRGCLTGICSPKPFTLTVERTGRKKGEKKEKESTKKGMNPILPWTAISDILKICSTRHKNSSLLVVNGLNSYVKWDRRRQTDMLAQEKNSESSLNPTGRTVEKKDDFH